MWLTTEDGTPAGEFAIVAFARQQPQVHKAICGKLRTRPHQRPTVTRTDYTATSREHLHQLAQAEPGTLLFTCTCVRTDWQFPTSTPTTAARLRELSTVTAQLAADTVFRAKTLRQRAEQLHTLAAAAGDERTQETASTLLGLLAELGDLVPALDERETVKPYMPDRLKPT